MKVELGYGYSFKVSENTFDLEYKNPEKKNAYNLGYYTSIERLIRRVVHHNASKFNADADMMGFLEYWSRMQKELVSVLKEYNIQ